MRIRRTVSRRIPHMCIYICICMYVCILRITHKSLTEPEADSRGSYSRKCSFYTRFTTRNAVRSFADTVHILRTRGLAVESNRASRGGAAPLRRCTECTATVVLYVNRCARRGRTILPNLCILPVRRKFLSPLCWTCFTRRARNAARKRSNSR